MNDALRDLARIGEAMKAMPGISGVRRRSADDLIQHESWLVWLEGSWLADQAGTGDTIEAAYLDAVSRASVTRRAA